jgi:hypothetical protein
MSGHARRQPFVIGGNVTGLAGTGPTLKQSAAKDRSCHTLRVGLSSSWLPVSWPRTERALRSWPPQRRG